MVNVEDALQFSVFRNGSEPGIGDPQRVVEQVENDKRQDGKTAECHCPSGDFRLNMAGQSVRLRSGCAIHFHEGERRDNVEHEARDQADSGNPEGFFILVEKFRVGVDFRGTSEHLKVSHEMCNNEPQQRQASERNEPLFPDGGAPELKQ